VRDCGFGAPCPTGFLCEREDDGIAAVCRKPRAAGGDEGCAVGGGAGRRGEDAFGWALILIAVTGWLRRRRRAQTG
jgi:MYXO-CTERM domain-containing protein